MALRVAEALCATGGGGISCVCYTGAVRPQMPYKTGIAGVAQR